MWPRLKNINDNTAAITSTAIAKKRTAKDSAEQGRTYPNQCDNVVTMKKRKRTDEEQNIQQSTGVQHKVVGKIKEAGAEELATMITATHQSFFKTDHN